MKSILLSLLMLLFIQTQGVCADSFDIMIGGETHPCPGTTNTYSIHQTDANGYDIQINADAGTIIEWSEGALDSPVHKNVSVQEVAMTGYTNQNTFPYVKIRWNNVRGVQGYLHVTTSEDGYPFTDFHDEATYNIAVGSPDITGTTAYSASCDTENIGFYIPEVIGASSYNWQNTMGWSLVQTFNNGGYTYATFSSNGSTATSGQVTVSVVNNGCPSNNSTKTFVITRPAGDHVVNGPDVVPPSQYADYTAPDGTNYNWYVSTSNGWRIVSGQGTNHIQVQAPANNNLQLPIGVNYTDVCGQQQTGSILVSTQTYDNSFAGTKQTTEDGKPAKSAVAAQPVVLETAIYPNPVADELTVSSNGKEGKVFIYNSVGALVSEIAIKDGNVRTLINTKSLSAGTYQVQLKQSGLPDMNRHIVIQH